MTSAINPIYPTAGEATTASLRTNFLAAKNEIEALQGRSGFVDYNDTLTTTTPISVSASTWTKLTNNKLGALTKIDALPAGVTNLWNSSTNQLVLTELPINTRVRFRLDVVVTTTTANQLVKFRTHLAIGDAIEFSINDSSVTYKTSGAQDIAVKGSFYIGYTPVRTNPAEFQIFSDADCTVKVNGWYIEIDKAI